MSINRSKLPISAHQLLFFLLAWLLTGCAITSDNKAILLSDHVSFRLTAPPLVKIATLDSHLVEISTNNKSHQFIAQVEYRRNEIAMAAISPEGLPLFDFIWFNDKASEVNQYVPLPNVNIGFIIADIQLCNWPLSIVKSAISGPNVSVSQQVVANKKHVIWQRTIAQNNETIIKIEKLTDGYELVNIVRGYRIRLTNLDREN